MRSSFLVALAVSGLTAAVPTRSYGDHVVHEKRAGEPIEWTRHARAAAADVVALRVGLKQRNLEHADAFLYDVSDPDSPNYGQHWSAERVANTFRPSKQTNDETITWLVDSGIDRSRLRHSTGHNWIDFNATVAEAESLFNTQYHVFKHKESDGFRLACDEYSLPANIQKHIDFVMPTVQLDGLKAAKLKVAQINTDVGAPTGLTGLKNCDVVLTIDCLRAIYGFGPGNYSAKGNQMGIGEWSDYLYYPDLKIFFQNFTSPKIPPNTVPQFISIDGGRTSNRSAAEAGNVVESGLDFQVSFSIIWPQTIRQYQLGDSVNVDSVGTFNILLDALDGSYCNYQGGNQPYVDPEYPDPNLGGYTGPLQCGGAPKSNVFSVSYGQIEAALPRFYQERQCREWMKLGLQGVSVVFSSGDSGVANRYNAGYNNSCVNAKNGYVDQFGSQFSPSFPINCPYITTVGATQLKNSSIFGGEVAVSQPDPDNQYLDFYSGGGFSNIFPRPAYQDAAVKPYLSKYAPKYAPGVYNASGRGFPDVSALGNNLAVVYLNRVIGVGGTSASAPIFASLLTLLNEERIRAGKKPVGFVNPVLYKNPGMFTDITVGGNPGCGTKGFPASPGWDPVTGLGTPLYPKMKKVFLSLP